MGQWRGAWMAGVCLALMGCDSSPPAPSPETPPSDERSGSLPEPDLGTPAPAPDESTTPDEGSHPDKGEPSGGASTRSPLEAEPSLPARACIPWTYSAPPVQATACASDAVLADGTSQHARYDADSHPLEVRTFTASGALSQVETQVWRDGLQRLQRSERPSGSYDQTEWFYNAQSQLERRVSTFFVTSPYVNSWDYTYDAQGRLSQIVSHIGDSDGRTSQYTYDAAGRLSSIDGDCASGETRCATLTYWPNGRLKQHNWETGGGREFFKDSYNELGQLVSSDMHYDQAFADSTRAYDAAGHLIRLRESYQGSGAQFDSYRETLSTTVYDPAGQRERFARDLREVCFDDSCGAGSERWTYTRINHRTTLFCDTQIVALDEWDSDDDGVVDAQRTHERDATGRLVHEAYSGTPALDSGPVSRDFHYDCP
jgi:hypothetical protein